MGQRTQGHGLRRGVGGVIRPLPTTLSNQQWYMKQRITVRIRVAAGKRRKGARTWRIFEDWLGLDE